MARFVKIYFTPEMDQTLTEGLAQGKSLDHIAQALGLSRSPVTKRATELGLREILPAATPEPSFPSRGIPTPPHLHRDRGPLPPGDPYTWGLLTEGTTTEGLPYPIELVLQN